MIMSRICCICKLALQVGPSEHQALVTTVESMTGGLEHFIAVDFVRRNARSWKALTWDHPRGMLALGFQSFRHLGGASGGPWLP